MLSVLRSAWSVIPSAIREPLCYILPALFLLSRVVFRFGVYANPQKKRDNAHCFDYRFDPKYELDIFLQAKKIAVSHRSCKSERDGTTLNYSIYGGGDTLIYLSNGVGTGFFMWLPVLRALIKIDPEFFQKYTLLAPDYRGLFQSSDTESAETTGTNSSGSSSESSRFRSKTGSKKGRKGGKQSLVSIQTCADDMAEVLKSEGLGVADIDTVVAWSMGVQVCMSCLVLFCLVLSCLVLSCLVLSCPVLSCLGLRLDFTSLFVRV
jgi:hypothetical protein